MVLIDISVLVYIRVLIYANDISIFGYIMKDILIKFDKFQTM